MDSWGEKSLCANLMFIWDGGQLKDPQTFWLTFATY